MSTQTQLRRGSPTDISSGVGSPGELWVDTTNWIVYLMDGSTSGGHLVGGYTAGTNITITGNTISASGGGGGSPGGSNFDIQYNNSGVFGGSNNFQYDDATATISLGSSLAPAVFNFTNAGSQGSITGSADTGTGATSLLIQAGSSGYSGGEGNVFINGGSGDSACISAGLVQITGGASSGTCQAGSVEIIGGASAMSGGISGGSVEITGGAGDYGGEIDIRGGTGNNYPGGKVRIYGGTNNSTLGYPGSNIELYGGEGALGEGSSGGNILLVAGIGSGAPNGYVQISCNGTGSTTAQYTFSPNGSITITTSEGTAGQVITSGGSGNPVAWQSVISYQIITTTGSDTITSTNSPKIFAAFVGTQASETVQFPAAAFDGQVIALKFGDIMTSLTLTPNGGDTIYNGITSAVAGTYVEYVYNLSTTTWY